MAKVKGGLGKGLNALIPDSTTTGLLKPFLEKGDVQRISINDIQPNRNQPRKFFDKEKLDVLVESIKLHGLIQPIMVKPLEKGYEIVAGERRWKASREAGLKEIPCIIRTLDARAGLEIALIENLQREDLNPVEEANAYKLLMEGHGLTQEQLSHAVGKSRPHIANTVRLLNLEDRLQQMLIKEEITSGHARALLRMEDKNKQWEIGQAIFKNGLSVRETEALMDNMLAEKEKKETKNRTKDIYLTSIEDALKRVLGTKVSINKGRNKGKIEIEYYSDEDLERLIELLQKV